MVLAHAAGWLEAERSEPSSVVHQKVGAWVVTMVADISLYVEGCVMKTY